MLYKKKKVIEYIRNKTGRNVSILKREIKGKKYNLTLEQLFIELANNKKFSENELYTFGGCNCFID